MRQGVPVRFSARDRRAIRAALAEGRQIRDIAAQYDCSASRLAQEIDAHGLRPAVAPRKANGAANPGGYGEAELARMKALFFDGVSAAAIAETLSREFGRRMTRNAVIGKAHRMGWTAAARQEPSSPGAAHAALRGAPNDLHKRDLHKRDLHKRDLRKRDLPRRGARNPRGARGDFAKSAAIHPAFVEPAPLAIAAPRLAATGDALLAAGQQPVGCRYVEGVVSAARSDDPAAGGWRYCQRAAAPGSTLCPAHRALCLTSDEKVKSFALAAAGAAVDIAAAIEAEFGVTVSAKTVAQWRRQAAERRAA